MRNYIFTSERLGFRNWQTSDIDLQYEINSNDEVMRFFPSTQNRKQTEDFVQRMQQQFSENQMCYFAVELLETSKFIGFIGLCKQTYEVDFNPSVDIGWRLHPSFWHKGYATEGAKASLKYGFETIKLNEIIAVAVKNNLPSIAVMSKIGMQKVKDFKHPLLLNEPDFVDCVLYRLKKS